MDRIASFAAVHDQSVRALVLGTMPSVASLEQAFYYAHPRNCFWPMLADILGEAVPQDPAAKRLLLLGNRIALWDVAGSCVRPGSLDSAIRDATPNNIGALIADSPNLQRILFNGGTAKQLFLKLLPGVGEGIERIVLPSTSPAHTMRYENKRAAWADALSFLKGERS